MLNIGESFPLIYKAPPLIREVTRLKFNYPIDIFIALLVIIDKIPPYPLLF